MPEGPVDKLARVLKKNRAFLDVAFEFMPSKNGATAGYKIKGSKKTRGSLFTDGIISLEDLRYARIDVNYYFRGVCVRESDCSLYTLYKLYLFKEIRSIYLSIFKHKVTTLYKSRLALRSLRSPLKSKYDLYAALAVDEAFLRSGRFRRSSVSRLLFGDHYMGDLYVYRTVSQSIDWILAACEDDGEIVNLSPSDTDPLYLMKGKGIQYFTITRDFLETSATNRKIQDKQVSIQRNMAWLTALLVIGTLWSPVENWPEIKLELVNFFDLFIPAIYAFLN